MFNNPLLLKNTSRSVQVSLFFTLYHFTFILVFLYHTYLKLDLFRYRDSISNFGNSINLTFLILTSIFYFISKIIIYLLEKQIQNTKIEIIIISNKLLCNFSQFIIIFLLYKTI
jgi:hypothetical protein